MKNKLYLCVILLACLTIVQGIHAQTFDEYYEKASEASRKGNHEEAIVFYTKAIELNPFDSLYSLRAMEYQELGKLELALADMNKAVDLSDSHYSEVESRGLLYLDMGKYDLALADFAKVLTLQPHRFRSYNHRSWAYLMWGKPDLAYAEVVKFLNSKDPYDGGDTARAIFVGYLSLRKAGKTEEAKKYIDKWAPQFKPDSWDGMIALFLQGAITPAQLLAAQTQDQSWAHFYIGEMLLLAGDRATAEGHFKAMKDTGVKYSFEYDMAVVELNRIKSIS